MDDPTLPGIENKTDRDILVMLASSQHYIRRDAKETVKEVKKQNGRIRSLEDWRTRILGGLAVIIGISPLFIADVRNAIAATFGG